MDALIKKLRNDKKILAGYIIAFLLLFIIYLFSLSKNQQMHDLSERVDHTYNVINQLEGINASVKDAENGVRGYIVTGDRGFLTPFFGSESKTDSICSALKARLEDNDLQLQRLARLERGIDRRFEILNFAISDFENNNRVLTDSMRKLQQETQLLMSNFRGTINQMKEHEYDLLKSRKDKFDNSFGALNTISLLALFLSLGLAVFVVITYFQSMRERQKGVERIRSYQAELTRKIEELNKANTDLVRMRSQEKFAATGRIARTIAHEVRNPLTNINLATEQLKSELNAGTENSEMLFEMIARNSQRINQLISDLLNSTKFSELNYEKVQLNDLVNEVLEDAGDRLALSNAALIKKFTPGQCIITVDKQRMKIAILNLVINAVEALEETTDAKLTVETQTENKKCRIIIRDNGPGMDKESVSRLFEPYFTTKPKGNGLGLTNTQNIILNHKGEISVESEPGKGTVFSISMEMI